MTLPLEDCLGRILAEDILSGEDIPALDRSCMDGYALRAADTFGASEGNPAYVELVRSAAIDEVVSRPLRSGGYMGIATGGSLPPGADAVLMVEHAQMLGDTTVEIRKTVTPGENVMLRGEDVGEGQVALPAGRRLRPQDVGLMAAIGRLSARVRRRPRCGIISTGDELVPVASTPGPDRSGTSIPTPWPAWPGRPGPMPAIWGWSPTSARPLSPPWPGVWQRTTWFSSPGAVPSARAI